jgi:hypothetical protein
MHLCPPVSPNNQWRFWVSSNDGFRFYLDGVYRRTDRWLQQDWTTAYEIPTTGLSAGFHWIRLEHFEGTGNARIKLEWQQGTGSRSVIPLANLYAAFPGLDSCPAPGSAALNPNSPQALAPLCQVTKGLNAILYPNITQSGSAAANIVVPNVNFTSWGFGVPNPPFNVSAPAFPVDNFSIRFYGSVIPSQTDTYRFTTAADDGAILYWHNGAVWERLINQPFQPGSADSRPLTLNAGQAYAIVLDYTEVTGGAQIQLAWKIGSATAATIIQTNNLSTAFINGYPPPATATPTLTPTPSPSPSPTSEPALGIWYVVCQIPGGLPGVRARNFPTGDGQEILKYSPGTVLYEFERRKDRGQNEWIRVTGYEAYAGETLWVAIATGGGTNLQNTPLNCPQATPPPVVTPQPTATVTWSYAVPNCLAGHYCPHHSIYNSNPNNPNVDVLAFVLACEANNRVVDATNIAWVFRNRARSGLFRDFGGGNPIWNVMRQSGAWDCFIHGSLPSSSVTSIAIINSDIRTVAQNMLSGNWSQIPNPTDMRIRWYGLYTYGTGPYSEPNNGNDGLSASALIEGVRSNVIVAGQCPFPSLILESTYVARSPFGNPQSSFTTVFFADTPIQFLTPC